MDIVLLVEDDPAVADITSMVLEDAGYQILIASDSTQAARIVSARDDIAVLFTDVNLRGGPDGLAMALEMRRQGLKAGIIVTSGDLSWANQIGDGVSFLAKPYGTADLLRAVNKARENRA